ncbi:MAG: LacI family DNA-binding transcriptional regulator [Paludibacter sp.]|nr:LacI family DNA-binding transcriptional regulator [Paludibacter sp.]
MNKRITIKDIAKELNIHHSTVSRALRNDPRVNEKTRDVVLAYAREHEYQTNMNAVQLRGTSNNAIALIVPNINHSFFADVISQLTNIAFQKGYVISVFQSNEKYEQEKEIINTIIQHNFAGVIVSIAKDTQKSDHFRLLKKFGIPLVFFDRVCEDIIAPKVIVNNYDITASATEWLIKKGYSRIAHITGTNIINVFRNRDQGYQDTLNKFNLVYKNSIEIKKDFSIEIGKEVFQKLWSSTQRPDAIISSSVNLTLGILVQAKILGVKIPEELGLITFGNMMTSEIYQPQITTIEQQETEIAQTTFELLEDMIANNNNQIIVKEIKAQLILRESC